MRRIADDVEAQPRFVIAVFSVLFFLGVAGASSLKLLWYDELATLYINRLPSLGQVLSLLYADKDGNPPLFHILSHISLRLFGAHVLALRLPEILGFWTMCVCLYHFVARRSSPLNGVVALLFPCITAAYGYAYEARPYGLVLGFCGLALVFWQRATEPGRRPGALAGLALSLGAAISCHYYAVLLYLPLAVGELVRWGRSKQPDFALWVAAACSASPLMVFLPLIAQHRQFKGLFWAKAQWTDAIGFYSFLLEPAAIPAAVMIVVLAVAWKSGSGPKRSDFKMGPVPQEMAAAVTLAVLPVFAVILGKAATGAFTDRYALPAVAGISLLAGLIPAVYEDSGRRLAAGMAVGLYVSFGITQIFDATGLLTGPNDTLARLALPSGSDPPGTPVVVSDGRVFLQMYQYCPPELRQRLYYLADPAAAVKYTGLGNVDVELTSMASYVPIQVVPYRAFAAAHPRFQLYGPCGVRFDWDCARLVDEGASLRLLGKFGDYQLFQAALPAADR